MYAATALPAPSAAATQAAVEQRKRIGLRRDVVHGFMHCRRQTELCLVAADPAEKELLVLDLLVNGKTLGRRGAQSFDGAGPAISGLRRRMGAGGKRHARQRGERDGP